MSGEETQEDIWTSEEVSLLTLARELEWAEAYAEEHPDCRMGQVYLDFLHWEMIMARGQV